MGSRFWVGAIATLGWIGTAAAQADGPGEHGALLRGAVQPPPVLVSVHAAHLPERVLAPSVPVRPWALPPSTPAGATAPAVRSGPPAPARPASAVVVVPLDAPPARAVVAACPTACAPDECTRALRRRGPVEVRDEWLLAQPHLSLPAASPDPLPCGEWRVRLAANRGNDFGWTQTRAGELPQGGDRRFLVDGEHQTTELGVRYGLTRSLDVGVRIPVQWRGPGFMDEFIDFFHETTGLLDNIRSAFTNDLFRVEGRTPDGERFSWNDEQGWGLGRVELSAQWAFLRPCSGRGLAAALIGRVTLPTGTGPFDVGGIDSGLQAVAAVPIGERFDFYFGLGGTFFGETELDGVLYEPLRGSGFAVLEWRPGARWSLFLEYNASSRLVTNIAQYPAIQSYLNLSAKFDLSRRWTLEAGIVENLVNQQSTTDFGAFAGIVARF